MPLQCHYRVYIFHLSLLLIVLHVYLVLCQIKHLPLRNQSNTHAFVYILTVSTHNGASTILFSIKST